MLLGIIFIVAHRKALIQQEKVNPELRQETSIELFYRWPLIDLMTIIRYHGDYLANNLFHSYQLQTGSFP